MTDLLTRLAMRAVGQGPLVRPQMRAHFAASPAMDGEVEVRGEPTLERSPMRYAEARADTPRSPAPLQADNGLTRDSADVDGALRVHAGDRPAIASRAETAGRSVSATPTARRAGPTAALDVEPSLSPDTPGKASDRPRVVDDIDFFGDAPPIAPRAIAVPRRSVAERADPDVERVSAERTAPDIERQAGGRSAEGREAPSSASIDEHASTRPRVGTATPMREIRAPLLREARPSAPDLAMPEHRDDAPVVHVTIGRVEIRATMPAPPPAPRAAPSAPRALSLDDYLAHRQGPAR